MRDLMIDAASSLQNTIAPVSSFEIGHSFVIRTSTFVIPPPFYRDASHTPNLNATGTLSPADSRIVPTDSTPHSSDKFGIRLAPPNWAADRVVGRGHSFNRSRSLCHRSSLGLGATGSTSAACHLTRKNALTEPVAPHFLALTERLQLRLQMSTSIIRRIWW